MSKKNLFRLVGKKGHMGRIKKTKNVSWLYEKPHEERSYEREQ